MNLIQPLPSKCKRPNSRCYCYSPQCGGLPFGQGWTAGHRGLPVSSHFTDESTEAERKIGYSMSIKTRPLWRSTFPTPGSL